MNSKIAQHLLPRCLSRITPRPHLWCPVNEEAAFVEKWKSFQSFSHVSQLAKGSDFLVAVPGKITVVPGGTCAHVNARIHADF